MADVVCIHGVRGPCAACAFARKERRESFDRLLKRSSLGDPSEPGAAELDVACREIRKIDREAKRAPRASNRGAISVVVDSKLRLRGDVPEHAEAALRALCEHDNPKKAQMARLARSRPALRFAMRKMPDKIRTWERDSGGLVVPRGLISTLTEVLGPSVEWIDRRVLGTGPRWSSKPIHSPDPRVGDGGALRWYQEAAIDAVVSGCSGIVRAPTGSGKTCVGVGLHARLNLPTLVVVWTGALREQWTSRAARELGVPESAIGIYGGGEKRVRPLTIGMLQTLSRAGNVDDAFARTWGLVIVDEVQYAPQSVLDVVAKIPARYRVGISADHTRQDGLEAITRDVFGPVLHETSQDDLIADGSVIDVECRLIPTRFAAEWYVEQRESGAMPDHGRLLDELAADAERNAAIVAVVAEEAREGRQVLAFSHRVEHCRALDVAIERAGVRCGLMVGGADYASRFDESIAGLRDGRFGAAVGTVQAVGTGIDLPSLSRGVLTMPVGNNRQLYQQIRGRLSRPGKSDAALYVLWDYEVGGWKVLRNMLAWNRRVVVRRHDGTWADGAEYLKEGTRR